VLHQRYILPLPLTATATQEENRGSRPHLQFRWKRIWSSWCNVNIRCKTSDGHPSHRYYLLKCFVSNSRSPWHRYGEPEGKSQSIGSLPTWRADTYCLGIWWFVTLTLLGRTIGISEAGQVAFVDNNWESQQLHRIRPCWTVCGKRTVHAEKTSPVAYITGSSWQIWTHRGPTPAVTSNSVLL